MSEIVGDMDMHPLMLVKLPLWGMPKEGGWNGRSKVNNVLFSGFKAKTNLG